jgi:hypothetical protein
MLDILKAAPANVDVNRRIGHNDLESMSIGWLLRGPHEASVYFTPFFQLLGRLCGRIGVKPEEPDRLLLEKSK